MPGIVDVKAKDPEYMLLSHPTQFSPDGICGTDSHVGVHPHIRRDICFKNGYCVPGFRTIRPPAFPDVTAALSSLSADGVELSNFVVNFGAADGACGHHFDDWNYDPANCLTSAGAAAVLIEGNPTRFPDLRKRFSNRRNVFMLLDYIKLEAVVNVLREQIQNLLGASVTPDLLKIDVDHADCLFMAEALKVIQPKLIYFEFWPLVPPPLEYQQHYQDAKIEVGLPETNMSEPGAVNEGRPSTEMAGCSLESFLKHAPGFELAAVGPEDALLVRRDLAPALQARGIGGLPPAFARGAPTRASAALNAWAQGCLCNPLHGTAPGTAAWGFDFRALSEPSVSLEERARWLERLMAETGSTAFTVSLNENDDS